MPELIRPSYSPRKDQLFAQLLAQAQTMPQRQTMPQGMEPQPGQTSHGLALGTEPTQAAWFDCMNRFAGWADRASDTVRGGPHRQDASAIPDPINQHIT